MTLWYNGILNLFCPFDGVCQTINVKFMLKGSFTELWNKAMIYTGSGWLVLVCMIWVSGHFTDNVERIVFVSVLAAGYIAVYMLGFYIKRQHSGKAVNL
ncbi:hypothetical protein [Chlorobium sp. KB01]|uniref:hypothetical protein n=1 Tax=Chlorobium sp. KB01 TaxID=1917528 RepID=UPI001E5C048F|nr:hypothetical protein [Chlorobium sp. KB01]